MTRKRKDRFVVGYTRSGNCVYGEEDDQYNHWVDPICLEKVLERFPWLHAAPAMIYELVPRPDLVRRAQKKAKVKK